ncbi:MAG: LEA type 2 family protein [Planctomycetota bacterium]
MKGKLFVFLVLVFLTACSSAIEKRQAIKNCDFTISTIRLESLGLTSLTLRLDVDVYNPNEINLIIDKLEVDIWINDRYVGRSINRLQRTINPGESKNVPLHLHLKYAGAYKTFKDYQDGKKLTYKFKGKIYFNTVICNVEFPFEK